MPDCSNLMFSIRKFVSAIALSCLLLLACFPASAAVYHSDDYDDVFDGSTFPEPETVDFSSVTAVEPDGVNIFGVLHKPAGDGPFSAVVVLHGCSGVYSRSDPSRGLSDKHEETAIRLTDAGYVNLHVMSFVIADSREDANDSDGDRPYRECNSENEVDERTQRAYDAYAGLNYLSNLNYVDEDQVAVMGWSHGGQTVQHVVGSDHSNVSPDFKAAVSFYGGCGLFGAYGGVNNSAWSPRIPTLMLHGGNDDLYQDKDCQKRVATANSDSNFTPDGYAQIVVYDGADHSFDGEEFEEFEEAWEDYQNRPNRCDLDCYNQKRVDYFAKVHADQKLIDFLDVYVHETKTLDEVDLSPEDSLTKITVTVQPSLLPETPEPGKTSESAPGASSLAVDLDDFIYDPLELQAFVSDDPALDLRMKYAKVAGPNWVNLNENMMVITPPNQVISSEIVRIEATNPNGLLIQDFSISRLPMGGSQFNSIIAAALANGFKAHNQQVFDVMNNGSIRLELDDFVEPASDTITFEEDTPLAPLGLTLENGRVVGDAPTGLPLDLSFNARIASAELPFTIHLDDETVDVGFGPQAIVKASINSLG